jgi:hypothetical protein
MDQLHRVRHDYLTNSATPPEILAAADALPASPVAEAATQSSKKSLQRMASRKILAQVNNLRSGESIDLKGFLNKRGVTNRAWKKRWFVLCSSFLLYFESEKSATPLGEIAIQTATFREEEKPGEFVIQTADREFFLQAASELGKHEWMVALKKAKAECWKKHSSIAPTTAAPAEEVGSPPTGSLLASRAQQLLRRGNQKRGSRLDSVPLSGQEGWVQKRGGRTTGWKLRWCVMQQDNLLYFKAPQNRDACGFIPLADSACSPIVLDQDDKPSFTLTTRQRVYFFRADTLADAQQWVRVLAVKPALSTSAPLFPTSSTPPVSPAATMAASSQNTKQGYLYKQGGQVRNWKKRYFVLHKLSLRYYISPSDQSPLGEIPLLNGTVEVTNESLKRNYSWSISTRFRNYYLAADDEYEMVSWMEAIRASIDQSPDDPKDQKRWQLYNLFSRTMQQLELTAGN